MQKGSVRIIGKMKATSKFGGEDFHPENSLPMKYSAKRTEKSSNCISTRIFSFKAPVIIYHLGGEGGRRILRGNDLIFKRTEGGITEDRKGGITKNFGRIQGDHSKLLGQCQTWGESRKLLIVMRGITSMK